MSDMVGVPACLLLWWLFVIQRVQNKNVYCGDNGDSEGYSVIQIKSCVITYLEMFSETSQKYIQKRKETVKSDTSMNVGLKIFK